VTNKKRKEALALLAQEMNVHKEVRTDVNILKETKTGVIITKPKSRVVSNVPWYPKSKKLKKELKLIALHEETTITGLIDEGIRRVLNARGKDIDDYL
jgi:hypothetical protein